MTQVQLCNHYTTKTQQRVRKKKKILRGISIGFQLMCLITFAFYCVKEEMMKMVDENGGDTQV